MFEEITIGDCCEVGDGAHASIARVERGVPYLTSKNFSTSGINLDSVDFISDSDYEKHFRSHSNALTKPAEGDLIFSIIGSLGGSYLYGNKDRFGLSSSVAILRPHRQTIDSEYLLYYLKSEYLQKWVESIKSGSAQGFLSLAMIKRLPVVVPPLPTQKKIASILSAYDELIENNTQRIGLLEEMAEEIYKEWFVRMRFPGHEQCRWYDKEGNEVEKGTEGGLPEGWRENQLSQLCAFNMGQSPKSEHYNEDGVGLAFHQGVTNFNKRLPTHAIFCTDAKRIAEHGDILLSVRAPVGRLNIADRRLIIGRGLCAVRQKSGFNTYLYYHLSDVFKVLDAFGNGAVFNAVSKTDLEKIKTIIPHVDVMKSFEVICKPIDGEIDVLTQKNQVLQETRDLLLPRLISGKLSVDGLAEKEPRLAMAAEPEMLYGK